MLSRRSPIALLVVLAVVGAGCGAGRGKPYTASGTAPCLSKNGFTKVTTNLAKVGFIAGFADNGGLRATDPTGNVLTIAFTADDSAVAGTKKAFTDAAGKQYKHHMQDIMESQQNAVLVWTVTPDKDQLDQALACLHW
jgi:hypothetical protein